MWSISGEVLSNETFTSWQAQPKARGTFGIFYGCMITLILCVWKVVHLNIPECSGSENCTSPQDIRRVIESFPKCLQRGVQFLEDHTNVVSYLMSKDQFLRKILASVAGILTPEAIVFIAIRQWWDARKLKDHINEVQDKNDDQNEKNNNEHDLEKGLKQTLSIRSVNQSPESKWTMTQSFYVVMGGIALDIKDIRKSEDPHRRTLTAAGLRQLEWIPKVSEDEILDKSKASSFVKVLFMAQALWFCLQCLGRLGQGLPISLLELSTLAHATCGLLCCFFWWSKPVDVQKPNIIKKKPISKGRKPAIKQVKIWVHDSNKDFLVKRVHNGPEYLVDYDLGTSNGSGIILAIVSAVYGGLHCLAWNAAFSSVVEKNLWRVCAVAQALTGFVLLLNSNLKRRSARASKHESDPERSSRDNPAALTKSLRDWFWTFWTWCCFLGIFFVRLYIFVECFLNLRHLPISAYKVAEYSQYIPHIQ